MAMQPIEITGEFQLLVMTAARGFGPGLCRPWLLVSSRGGYRPTAWQTGSCYSAKTVR